MIKASKSLSVALAFLLMLTGGSVASAQSPMSKDEAATSGSSTSSASQLNLNADQGKKLWTEISDHAMKQNAPSGFNVAVGQIVPISVSLRELPNKAQTEVPAAKPYQYAMVDNKLLLVNPSDKKIVEVITQ
jgi:Protein of unknown function (DUF1236)